MTDSPLQVYMLSLLKKYGVLSLTDIPTNLLMLECPHACIDFEKGNSNDSIVKFSDALGGSLLPFLPQRPPDSLPEGYNWYGVSFSYLGLKKGNFLKAIQSVGSLFSSDNVLVFVPYCYDSTGGSKFIVPIVEGIIFVAAPGISSESSDQVRQCNFFSSFITRSNNQPEIFSCQRIIDIYNRISSMVLKKFSLGDKVLILSGPHKNLVGTVIGYTSPNLHFVELKFLSTVAVVALSSIFLEGVGVEYEDPFEVLNNAYISHDSILNDLT